MKTRRKPIKPVEAAPATPEIIWWLSMFDGWVSGEVIERTEEGILCRRLWGAGGVCLVTPEALARKWGD